jgi:hypothetical protein
MIIIIIIIELDIGHWTLDIKPINNNIVHINYNVKYNIPLDLN